MPNSDLQLIYLTHKRKEGSLPAPGFEEQLGCLQWQLSPQAVVHKSKAEDVTAGDKMVSTDQKDGLGKGNQSCRRLVGQMPLMSPRFPPSVADDKHFSRHQERQRELLQLQLPHRIQESIQPRSAWHTDALSKPLPAACQKFAFPLPQGFT